MEHTNETRDEKLGAVLNDVPPPDYEGDFFDELRQRLEPITQNHQRRKIAALRSRRLQYVSGSLVAAAAVVVVVMLVSASLSTKEKNGSDDVAEPPTRTAPSTTVEEQLPVISLAAQVVKNAQTTFRTATSLSGNLTVSTVENIDTYAQKTYSSSFSVTAKGDYRLDGKFEDGTSYLRVYNTETRRYNEQSRLADYAATGPADGGLWSVPSTEIDYLRSIGSALDALAESGDPRLVEADMNGRKVWQLTAKTDRTTSLDEANEVTVLVDQETSFPISVKETRNGAPIFSIAISGLKLNPPIDQKTFAVPSRDHANEIVTYEKIDVASASKKAGYAVPNVGFVPIGFTSEGMQYASEYVSLEDFTGGERIIAQSFHRGFDRINVSTGRIPSYADRQPFRLVANADVLRRERLTVGMYAGIEVQVVRPGPLSQPLLWGVKDNVIFFIQGNADVNTLLKMANGLTA